MRGVRHRASSQPPHLYRYVSPHLHRPEHFIRCKRTSFAWTQPVRISLPVPASTVSPAPEERLFSGVLETLLNAIGDDLSPAVTCVMELQNQGDGHPDGSGEPIPNLSERAQRYLNAHGESVETLFYHSIAVMHTPTFARWANGAHRGRALPENQRLRRHRQVGLLNAPRHNDARQRHQRATRLHAGLRRSWPPSRAWM